MERINGSSVSPDLFGAGKDGFKDGDKALGISATVVNAEFMNGVQEEIVNVIESAGLIPSAGTLTQMRDAIKALIKGGGDKIVRVASTVAINLAAPGANIDGVAMVAGDVFLDKDNATAASRGIYVWNGAAVPATRATYADDGTELAGGMIVRVKEGTANADTNWQLTNDGTVTIGATGLTFVNMQPISQLLLVRDEKASGTDGGACVATAMPTAQTRVLNTVVHNTIAGASLASNQITLPAGTYLIDASAPSSQNQHRAFLYNVTDAAITALGTCENVFLNATYSGVLGIDTALTRSRVLTVVTLAATKSIELRHFTSEARATTGLGAAIGNAGQNEVYSEVLIRKL